MKEEKKPIDECTYKANISQVFDHIFKELTLGEYGIDPSRLSPEAYSEWEMAVKRALEEEVKRHRDVRPQQTA